MPFWIPRKVMNILQEQVFEKPKLMELYLKTYFRL